MAIFVSLLGPGGANSRRGTQASPVPLQKWVISSTKAAQQ